MALLFITHKFPPGLGGMERQSYELLNGMSAKQKCYSIIQSPAESKLWFFLTLWYRIRVLLKRHPDISIIHANDAVVASFCSLYIYSRSIKKTATFHGLDIVFPNLFFQQLVVPRLRTFDRIYTVSKATAHACYQRGFKPEQIRIIKNGVDHKIASQEKDILFANSILQDHGIDFNKHILLLSTGRAVKRKGFSWFIKNVMTRLDHRYRYVIIGPMAGEASFLEWIIPNRIAQQWNLFWGRASDSRDVLDAIKKDSRCLHLGSVEYDTLLKWMSHADLFIMPNQEVEGDMEGFGLVALEAGLSGTYVLASDIEGITCAVQNNLNGTLIRADDPINWKQQIDILCASARILRKKGNNARAFVLENFKWSRMIEQYHQSFKHLQSESSMGLSPVSSRMHPLKDCV